MKTDSINITSDSIASSDSTQSHYYQAKYLGGFGNSPEQDSVIECIDHSNILTIPAGQNSEQYMPSPLHDTGIMTLFLISMFLVTLSMRKGYKYVSNFKKNLFSIKKRDNVFEDHNTVNEEITLLSLIANTCIMEGILINCGLTLYFPSLSFAGNIFTNTLTLISIMVGFYLLQVAAYHLLGYVFTSKVNTSLLLKGFNASQALLGILLLPIVILLLVYSTYANTFIILFEFCYILCRIIFIIKGFRIFYSNYSSILFFILYLCSGEIVPLLVINSSIIFIFSII